MNSNLYINTGGHINIPENFQNTSNFLSMMKNRSLTTNESETGFTSQFNTITTNTFRNKHIRKKPFQKSKSNSKCSSQNLYYGKTETNNIFNRNSGNNVFLPYLTSRNQTSFLINNADMILKERKRNYMGRALKQTKSSIINKSKEVCLNNYLITQLREKRTEINDKQAEILSKLNNSEKRFEIDYKNFIDFVEKINKKEKSEEEYLNNLKNKSKNIETNFLEQKALNKNLESKAESLIKQIVILQAYGSFLHKVFYKPFIFDELKNTNMKGNKFLSLSDKIIALYEESQTKGMFQDIKDIVSDDELLMDKYIYYENKVVKIMKEKELLEQELTSTENYYKNTLDHLIYRKEDCEKELSKYNKDKKEILNLMRDYNNIDVSNVGEAEEYLKHIIELGIEMGMDMKKIKNKNNNNQNQIIESTQMCKETLYLLAEKEKSLNENIKYIDNVINSGSLDDKKLIENLIYERKKFIKKQKQAMQKELQEKEERNKELRTAEKARKIIIKGRKVFPDIPVFKNKKKIKADNNIEEENNEYLHYSSDED